MYCDLRLDRPNLHLLTGCEVTSVRKEGRFFVETADQIWTADRLILACGGPAGGKLGGTADGYRFARALGHRIVDPHPGLVQLKCALPRGLKGIRAVARLTLLEQGHTVQALDGEVQFTDYGLSGLPFSHSLGRWLCAPLPLSGWTYCLSLTGRSCWTCCVNAPCAVRSSPVRIC